MKKAAIFILLTLLLLPITFVPSIAAEQTEWHINSGGGEYTAVDGTEFEADRVYEAGSYGITLGRTYSFNQEIAGTDDDELYQTMRSYLDFAYNYDNMENGDYEVTVHIMDPFSTDEGQRRFYIEIENVIVRDNFDVYAETGGAFTAFEETYLVTVADGQLNVDFRRLLRSPFVSAVSVVKVGASTPEPEIDVTPASLDFGDVEIGQTADMVVTIANSGDADLNVSSLSVDNSVFTIETPIAPAVIAPNGSQDVTLRFAPAAEGSQSGILDIVSDDADEATVSIALHGNGTTPPPVEPEIDVTPTSLDFGDVEMGQTADLQVTISNSGIADLNVSSITSDNALFTVETAVTPAVIAPSGSVDVTIQFAPDSEGAAIGTLTIASDDTDEPSVDVSLDGNGTTPPPQEPDITVSTLSVDFGNVAPSNSYSQTVMISNDGIVDLTVSSLSLTNPVFSMSSATTPIVIAPGGSSHVTITFSPTEDGAQTDTLTIVSDDPDEASVDVAIQGTAVSAPAVAFRINAAGDAYTDSNGYEFEADKAYSAGDFGYSGNTRSFDFNSEIANTIDDPLYQTVKTNANFSYLFDLDDGEYTVILHFMEPWQDQAGERTFDVIIEGDVALDDYDIVAAAGGQYTAVSETVTVNVEDGQLNIDFDNVLRASMISAIEVIGGGPAEPPTPEADISLSATSLDFDQVLVGETADLVVTVSNDGDLDLTVSDMTVANGVFTIESPAAPFTLSTGQSQDVTIRFSPAVTGEETGSLDITSDDPNDGLVSVALTGEGVDEIVEVPELNVFDWDREVTEHHRGFPNNTPPRENFDYTGTPNYANGTLYFRAEIHSQPVAQQQMKIQLCYWQELNGDNFALENCGSLNVVAGNPGNVVCWDQPIATMWKLNNQPIDWSRERYRIGLAIKNGANQPVSNYNGWNWNGEDPADWYPLDMHFTAILVAEGETFSGFSDCTID